MTGQNLHSCRADAETGRADVKTQCASAGTRRGNGEKENRNGTLHSTQNIRLIIPSHSLSDIVTYFIKPVNKL